MSEEWSAKSPLVRRTYSTPVGSVWTEERREPGVGQWHAQRSWRDVSPWQTARMIKGPDDYAVVKYMVENYNVKLDRIYLVGYSMGVQIVAVTAAKFPHVFAAVLDNKGPTDHDL